MDTEKKPAPPVDDEPLWSDSAGFRADVPTRRLECDDVE